MLQSSRLNKYLFLKSALLKVAKYKIHNPLFLKSAYFKVVKYKIHNPQLVAQHCFFASFGFDVLHFFTLCDQLVQQIFCCVLKLL